MSSEQTKFTETLVGDTKQPELTASLEDKHFNTLSEGTEYNSKMRVDVSNSTKKLLENESNSQSVSFSELSSSQILTRDNYMPPWDTSSDTTRNADISDPDMVTEEDDEKLDFSDPEMVTEEDDERLDSLGSSLKTNPLSNSHNILGPKGVSTISYNNPSVDEHLLKTVTLLTTPDGGKLYHVGNTSTNGNADFSDPELVPQEEDEKFDNLGTSLKTILPSDAHNVREAKGISTISEFNPIDECLPETLTILTTPDGGKLYLVGTAHFSLESQNDVAKIIQAVQPHIVMIELCTARVGLLELNEETMYRYSQNLNFQCIRDTIKAEGVYSGVMQILLLQMVAHLTKQLGMAPGGEFRRAFHEAKKVPNCTVLLGDRPINITIQRAFRSLSWWQTIKFIMHLIFARDPITKEDVEMCKQRELLEALLTNLRGQFPVLGEVFVKERDIYLTYSLQLSCLPQCTSDGLVPARVVGVVGLGHISGIVENWGKVQASDIPPLMSIPPLSLSTKILRFTIRASLISAVLYIGYKVIPLPLKITLQSIKSSAEELLKVCTTR